MFLLSNLIFAYALCLWPAFCVTLARSFSNLPEVEHTWLYLITASLLAILGSLLAITAVIRLPELDPDSMERYTHCIKLRATFLKVSVVGLILFLLWPESAAFLYGWILSRGI
jgi:hypothetical protein